VENNKKEIKEPAIISIGKKLKEAREKKLLSIEQVQKETRIHSTVLIALEEGRASEILPDTYVRSFLKKYAQFLGLNSAGLLKEYFPPHHEIASSDISVYEKVLPQETTAPPKFLYVTGMAILVVISVLVAVFMGGRMVSYLRKPKAGTQRERVISAIAAKKKPKTAKAAVNKKSEKKSNLAPKESIPQATALNLVIKTKEPVLIKLKKDGILLFERVLPKDLVETVVAKNSIELDISRSQALELILNGRPIVLPPKKALFSLEITRKGVRLK
jgi:cytoskeletal protein RodZ